MKMKILSSKELRSRAGPYVLLPYSEVVGGSLCQIQAVYSPLYFLQRIKNKLKNVQYKNPFFNQDAKIIRKIIKLKKIIFMKTFERNKKYSCSLKNMYWTIT